MITDSLDVLKWIRRAQMDFDGAVRDAKLFRPPVEIVCYLCQQAAEKILKAYIIAQTRSRIKTHDLEYLLGKCLSYSADFDNLRNCCLRLNPYVTFARYPSDIEPTEHHMRQAVKDAGEVVDFAKSKLKELGYDYDPEQ
ncbi:MAG: HEPN domain-containing protein [Chitinispirillales bacterium]|jgi:HEPN domain-containing protein|nr:HEPN domain-containing protein [Chitinispirillales bacterium]